ncbi:MAG: Gfo/Idh/MocA family oxidoreductase [Propionibacterium sp.]|jgi:predicted dehydrogenase|nr:Gfo/Idh/MocA family oxidoreductase [Propionibacterium sp.]
MSDTIKTAVLGCGKVGHFHAKCYQSLDGSEFVGAVGTRPGRGAAFGAEYGVPGFDSLAELVDRTGAQAVSICTPHPNHESYAVEAARLGLHIAIEKPLASTLADCDAIIAAAQQSRVIGTTICQRRFYHPAMRIKQAIDAGKLGHPILGTVNMLGWRDMAYYRSDPWRGTWAGEGGGVLVNQAPHQLDLLLWYMGEVDEVVGCWDTLNHPDLEVDDTAMALIRFRSGALGNIVVSNSQNPALFGNVRVHGSNGASVGVQTDGGAMFIAGMSGITEPPVNDLWTIAGEEDRLPELQAEDSEFFNSVDSMYYFHREQLADFLSAIREDRQPLITLDDGRRTVELFTAIYRSQAEHGWVKLPLES